jgi:hypothetical protein
LSFVRGFVRECDKTIKMEKQYDAKINKKCRKHLPKKIVDLLERPNVVELVKYFNGRLISYKVADEQKPREETKKKR